MSHADFIARYRVPVTVPDAPRPTLEWSRRGEGRARSLAGQVRRRIRGRRLAYIDSHFPWQRSGFRYADALALHEARPDTVFFSMYELRDPFPAPVLPLAQFPRLAPTLGVTDVYGVFLEFMAGALGLRRGSGREPQVIEGLDLSGVVQREGMRTHAGLYPGGGFVATKAGFSEARRLVAAADQVFSWMPAVLEHVPGVTPIDPAVIDTQFYAKTPRDFAARPLELLFAADAKPRKGLCVALAALTALAGEPVHLHVVGPHDPAQFMPADRTSFHGWLDRAQLRELHRRCHMFLSPVTAERPDDPAGDGGITDGFPTAAAAEAVSSGLLLLTANPESDHRHLRPGIDHIELPATPEAFADAVCAVLADPDSATAVAESGAGRVRERLDVRVGAAARLSLMGFSSGRTPFAPPPRARRYRAPRGRQASAARRDVEQRTAGNAIAADIRELAASLRELQTNHRSLAEQLQTTHRDLMAVGLEMRNELQSLAEQLQTTRRDLMAVGQLVLDDEAAVRHGLGAARAAPEYEAPFTESDPLVTVCIPTHTNYVQLLERSIPSVLDQDYRNIEVVVVGDAAPPETAAGIAQLNDPRVRYENLSVRGPYPDDPRERWLVAGTGPLNRALELARGAWIAVNNDDDALRPNHVSSLLALARDSRDEVVYGRLVQHAPDGSTKILGVFPPVLAGFGWQLALQHRAMRLFEFKLSAAMFGEPGDWDRARRMLRAGVRFSMIDEIVCDYYPSTLWRAG
jgi:glycosyltransferase involved in cell wall biosynthesis